MGLNAEKYLGRVGESSPTLTADRRVGKTFRMGLWRPKITFSSLMLVRNGLTAIQGDSKGHIQNENGDRGPNTESGKVGYLRSKMHQF